jgi:hypothetical protein
MMKLYGKRGFEDGLSHPQTTLFHIGDKHHQDQATAAPNNKSSKYMARNI